MDKVCRTCHYFDASEGVCTLDNFDTDNPVADELEYMFDSGELLEMLENELPDDKLKDSRSASELRLSIEGLIRNFIKNQLSGIGDTKITINDPRSFGCNKWL